MKLLLIALALLASNTTFSQDVDLIGSWESTRVMTGNDKKEELVNPSAFRSVLTLNADSTFTLITSGSEIVMGKYSTGPNLIIFFKLVGFESYQQFWDVRWPEGDTDPFPETPEFDFMIPTQALVQNKKKMKPFTSQVYAVFKKIVE